MWQNKQSKCAYSQQASEFIATQLQFHLLEADLTPTTQVGIKVVHFL